jgi:hypothetical protein
MIHRRVDVRLRARLREAARPEAITEERVRAYCADRGIEHHRFEAALLQQSLLVVEPDRLIERVLLGAAEPPLIHGRVYRLYWRRLRDWLRWNAGYCN